MSDIVLFYAHAKVLPLGVETFSQFYQINIKADDGTGYSSAEQFMQASKARLFGDTCTEAKIMKTVVPLKAKNLGHEVTPFDDKVWSSLAYKIAVMGNWYKFTQHEDLKAVLLSTGDKIIAEAAPRDLIWGIGMVKTNPKAQEPANWKGKNLLGKVLLEVRERIRNNDPPLPLSLATTTEPPNDGGIIKKKSPLPFFGKRKKTPTAVVVTEQTPGPASNTPLPRKLDDYLDIVNKTEDFQTFMNHILTGVFDDEYHKRAVIGDRYIDTWRGTLSGKLSSSTERDITGDKLYGCALLKLLYAHTRGTASPKELSNMNIYFSSTVFLADAADKLGFGKWVSDSSDGVEGRALIFKRFIAVLSDVSDSARKEYLESGDYENAAKSPSGFAAVERFLDTYLAAVKADLAEAANSPAKTFISQLPDLFGLRGLWGIYQSSDRTKFTFSIYDQSMLWKITKSLTNDPVEEKRIVRTITSMNEWEDSDESRLSSRVARLLNDVGLTREWVEKYRNSSRINSIQPESLRNLFTETLRGNMFDSAIFEYSESHSHETNGVKISSVIMYGVKSNIGGTPAVSSKTILYTKTGEIVDDNYTSLKNKTVGEWLKSV